MDNCIVKVTLTGTSISDATATVTVYAGSSGAADAYVEAAGTGATNARFAQATSILIADQTLPNGDLIGTMYVSDSGNNAIRRISPNGMTVDTLYGGNGTLGPGPTPPTIDAADTYSVASVTSLTWSSGTATVATSSPTLVTGIGCSIGFMGVVNSGTSSINLSDGNVNGEPFFKVNGFTDNRHFTIAMPASAGEIGSLTGSITAYTYYPDVYSPPGTVSLLAAQGWTVLPGTIRWSSARHMILAEFWSGCARDIDLAANTIRRIGMFDDKPQVFDTGVWMWMDCDYAGVLGPVDDVVLAKFQSNQSAAHYIWRLSFDGTVSDAWMNDGGLFPTVGQNGLPLEGMGHYPWAWSFSRTEGRAISSGTADYPPTSWRIQEPTDITVDLATNTNIAYQRWQNGQAIWQGGTVRAFPFTARPAFTALWGWSGNGHILGFTWDDLMHDTALGNFASTTPGDTGDQNLSAYIRSGMGGATPYPEITGNDMADLIYYIRRDTLQGSGLAGAAVVTPAPYSSDITPPIISNVSAVRNNATSITVTWTTDKSTIGFAAAGSQAQQSVAAWPYNVLSPIESGFSTSHNATITGIAAGASPLSYVVVSKDVAGNCVYSAARTIA
jgi:hypothetical protein